MPNNDASIKKCVCVYTHTHTFSGNKGGLCTLCRFHCTSSGNCRRMLCVVTDAVLLQTMLVLVDNGSNHNHVLITYSTLPCSEVFDYEYCF